RGELPVFARHGASGRGSAPPRRAPHAGGTDARGGRGSPRPRAHRVLRRLTRPDMAPGRDPPCAADGMAPSRRERRGRRRRRAARETRPDVTPTGPRPTWAMLAEDKARCDPTNLFQLHHAVPRPAGTPEGGAPRTRWAVPSTKQ